MVAVLQLRQHSTRPRANYRYAYRPGKHLSHFLFSFQSLPEFCLSYRYANRPGKHLSHSLFSFQSLAPTIAMPIALVSI